MVAAAVWVIPLLSMEIVSCIVFAFLILKAWRRKHGGKIEAPDHFDVGATVWCKGLALTHAADRRQQVILFAWRLIVLLWMVSVEVQVLCFLPWRASVLFYTNWNYLWQICYFGFACTGSATLLCGRQLSPRLRLVTKVFFEVSVPMSIFVSIVLWGVLMPASVKAGHPEAVFNFFSYNQHLANTACLLIEFCASRLQIHWRHLVVVYLWAGTYCVFAWVQHPFTNFWPYFFLKLSPVAPLWYTVMMALHVLMFALAVGLSRIKSRCANLSTPAAHAEGVSEAGSQHQASLNIPIVVDEASKDGRS